MRVMVIFRTIVLGLALTVMGCASPPSADVDAARAAVDKAVTDGASQYAPSRSRPHRMPGQPSTRS